MGLLGVIRGFQVKSPVFRRYQRVSVAFLTDSDSKRRQGGQLRQLSLQDSISSHDLRRKHFDNRLFVTAEPQIQRPFHGVAANENDDWKKQKLYEELQSISREIKQRDEFYYNAATLAAETGEFSDDEYDALCRREEEICSEHPDLLERWENESGLGSSATRYGGRVGIAAPAALEEEQSIAGRRQKRRHFKPMLSLDNVHDTPQLLAWLERVRKKIVKEVKEAGLPVSVTILTEPKLDGLSLNLSYKRAGSSGSVFQLQWASTRGDGKQGQDVTTAVQACKTVPSTVEFAVENDITPPSFVEIRGEVVLPKSVFEKHLAGDNRTFSNARNAASGILLRKEVTTTHNATVDWSSQLVFYAYELVVEDIDLDGSLALAKLTTMGFRIPRPSISTTIRIHDNETKWNESDVSNLLVYHDALRNYRENDAAVKANAKIARHISWNWDDYDMDGCVHKISEATWRGLLGASNRAPRWAVAHKFPPTAAVTELLDVFMQVGRTGALTPVALLKPVVLNGVTVQRATLHNFGHLQNILGSATSIPRGTNVLVRRAGEVIPQVVSVLGGRQAIDGSVVYENATISLAAPTKCPACGSPVITDNTATRSESSVSLGQVLRCGGPPLLCAPRAVSALQHAFSRDALDVTGLSEARIQQLMEMGLLRIPSDIFTLVLDAQAVEKLSQEIDGWGSKSTQNLVTTVDRVASNGVSLARYIYSLGIRFAGVHTSAALAAVYGHVDAFLEDLEKASVLDFNSTSSFSVLREDNDATKGIGPALLSSLMAFAKEQELVEAAKKLASSVVVHPDETLAPIPPSDLVQPFASLSVEKSKPLSGLTVVFTGSLPGLTRPKAKEIAKQMGAKATPENVSKATDLVVYGGKGGTKLDKATDLGIDVMEASKFLEMVQKFDEENE